MKLTVTQIALLTEIKEQPQTGCVGWPVRSQWRSAESLVKLGLLTPVAHARRYYLRTPAGTTALGEAL